ncbi:MAG: protease HtpX [Nitrospinaceae bacterium]|nr:MAG: protease HtpX [Nitrospinaceae bacterium]
MGRIALFLATNVAVLIVLSVILSLLGFNQPNRSATPLIFFAAVMGMGGSFISLLMSKSLAKRSTGAQVIQSPETPSELWLVDTVRRQAGRAGIGMPEVAVFPSASPNAFATGANKNSALVAVSAGLLDHMNQDEVEAVLGHEISHVANGDMVTLGLIQGVVNTFVLVFANLAAAMVDRRGSDGHSRGGLGYFATYMLAQVVLGFLASMIVMGFSRWREFRADQGGAEQAGRSKMIAALRRLQALSDPTPLPGQMDAFGINSGISHGLKKLFMSHPPLEERIAALEERAG